MLLLLQHEGSYWDPNPWRWNFLSLVWMLTLEMNLGVMCALWIPFAHLKFVVLQIMFGNSKWKGVWLLLFLVERNLIPLHDLMECGNWIMEFHNSLHATLGGGGGVIASLMLQGSLEDGLVEYMTKLHWQHVWTLHVIPWRFKRRCE